MNTYRGGRSKFDSNNNNYRASEASEILLGVVNAKSGICYMYVCMDGWYVCPLKARAGNFFS